MDGLPMTDPRQLCARAPQRAGQKSLPFTGDASTGDSELTAAAGPSQSVHSDDATDGSNSDPDERLAPTFGFGIDHTNGVNLAFPGFRALKHYLTDDAIHYLVSERQWSNQDDFEDTVGQKNTIIIFVGMATIEECLVEEKSGKLLPVSGPFQALMDTLGMRYNPNGTRRSHVFLSAIRDAFVRSRRDEIKRKETIENGPRPEPTDLSGLGRMLLDVVDRHLEFLRTKKPLTRLCVPIPLEKVLGLGLIQIKNQLRDKTCIEKCFTIFIPTFPTHDKTFWPRSGRPAAEDHAPAEHNVEASNAAVDPSHSENQDNDSEMHSRALRISKTTAQEDPRPSAPGNGVDGSTRPSHPTPAPLAWHPNALSGLQLFKAAASQAHQVIRCSKDNTGLGNFINQLEEDVKEFQEKLQPHPIPTRADSAGGPRPQIGVPLDCECIRSLMLIGLILINLKWNDQNLTDNTRQTILGDILEELHKIKEAADQVYTART